MIEILVLIAFIAIIGCIVAFIGRIDMPDIFRNLIYLIVALAMIFMVIHALQTGHLPQVRL